MLFCKLALLLGHTDLPAPPCRLLQTRITVYSVMYKILVWHPGLATL